MRKIYLYKAFYNTDNDNIGSPVVKYYKAHTDESAMLYAERYEHNGDDYKDYGHVSYKLIKVVRMNDDESEVVISNVKNDDTSINNAQTCNAFCCIAVKSDDVNDANLTDCVSSSYHPVVYNVGDYTILSLICNYNDETRVLQNIRERFGIETMTLMSVDLSDNFARIEVFGGEYCKDYDYILSEIDDCTDTEYDIAVKKIYDLFLEYLRK